MSGLVNALIFGGGFQGAGGATANLDISKGIADTWEDVYNAIIGTGVTNFKGFAIDIVLEGDSITKGLHPMGDYEFICKGWENGTINIRAAEDIAGTSGVDQTPALIFDGIGGFEFDNCDIDVNIRSIELRIAAGGNPAPFSLKSSNVVISQKCWYNVAAATDPTDFFMMGTGRLISYNDTFSGNVSNTTTLVSFGNGVENFLGGQITIFDSHLSGEQFDNAMLGSGTGAFIASETAFVRKTPSVKQDLSRLTDVPAMLEGRIDNIGAASASFVSEFNRAGTIYWSVLPTASSPPSIADIIAGTGSVDFGNVATLGFTEETESITGLDADTAYDLYYFGRDALSNDTPIYATAEFTTLDSFIFTIVTTSSDYLFTLPAPGSNNLNVEWDDGDVDSGVTTANPTHTYASPGTYEIKVNGTMPEFGFNNNADAPLVTAFSSWGNVGLTSLFGGFYGCTNLVTPIPTAGINNLTGLTSISYAFRASGITGSIPTNFLDVSTGLLNAQWVFRDCTGLTGSIPSTFLDNCTLLQNIQHLFSNASGITGSIPTTFLDNCTALTNVANVFRGMAGLTGGIPTTFLDNCTLLTTVEGLFRGIGITGTIPTTFLDNAPNCSNISFAFYFNQSLSGDAPDFWNDAKFTTFADCFTGDTQLTNYASIPNNWKGL